MQLPHCLKATLLLLIHWCCAALIAAAFKCQPSLRQPLLDELHSAVFPFLYPSGARAPPRHLLVRGRNASSNVSIQVRQTDAGRHWQAQHCTCAVGCEYLLCAPTLDRQSHVMFAFSISPAFCTFDLPNSSTTAIIVCLTQHALLCGC